MDLSAFNVLPSNSASVNGTQLNYAITQAKLGGFSLEADEGLYEIDGGTIEIGWQKFALIAKGPRVTFRQRTTLSGTLAQKRFFSINGTVNTPGTDGIKQITLGGPHAIRLWGNPNGSTSDVLYVNKCHDSQFNVRPRDGWALVRSELGVLNRYDVTSAPNWDEEAVVVPSAYGLLAYQTYASEFRLNLEGVGYATGGQQAAYFNDCARNWLKSGSLESNANGGLYLTSTCHGFVIDNQDLEVNGNGPDLVIHGSYNTVRNTSMFTAGKRSLITGDYNSLENCDCHGLDIHPLVLGANKNSLTRCNYLTDNGGFSDTGVGTIVRSCAGVADKN